MVRKTNIAYDFRLVFLKFFFKKKIFNNNLFFNSLLLSKKTIFFYSYFCKKKIKKSNSYFSFFNKNYFLKLYKFYTKKFNRFFLRVFPSLLNTLAIFKFKAISYSLQKPKLIVPYLYFLKKKIIMLNVEKLLTSLIGNFTNVSLNTYDLKTIVVQSKKRLIFENKLLFSIKISMSKKMANVLKKGLFSLKLVIELVG